MSKTDFEREVELCLNSFKDENVRKAFVAHIANCSFCSFAFIMIMRHSMTKIEEALKLLKESYRGKEVMSLIEFTKEMRNKMARVERKYGDFMDYSIQDLREHLLVEFYEWAEAKNTQNEAEELIDIANLAYMLWAKMR